MGLWGGWFLSDEIAQLEAFKKTLTDEEQIKQIEEIIAKLKEKNEQTDD